MSAVTERDRPGTATAEEARQDYGLRQRIPALGFAVRYLSMPLFLAIVLWALYAYVQALELDSIEARTLVWPTIRSRIIEHIEISALATSIVVLLAVPTGILCTRESAQKVRPIVLGVANAGQAIPSLGLITIFVIALAQVFPGRWAVIAGLVAYSFLPILRNTIAGIEAVDDALIEAARGMGMNARQVLTRIELPLAVPVMLAGIRVALILTVGTTTLAFLFPGARALGELIFQGFQLQRTPILIVGAVLAASLALLVDYVAGIAEDVLKPRGL